MKKEDDWILEEIPGVLGLIGEAAIAPASRFLASRGKNEWGRVAAVIALEKVAEIHSDLKERCIDRLASQLTDYGHNPETVNGFLVSSLVHLNATSKADLIERAFASEKVDESIMGNWPDAQIALGLATKADFSEEELAPTFEWVRETDPSPKPSALDLGLPLKRSKRKKGSKSKGDKKPDTKASKGFGMAPAEASKLSKSKKKRR
ncbi:MAG: hypothetical protein AAFO84_04255 [Cyanobacteria bacterium J06598_1]